MKFEEAKEALYNLQGKLSAYDHAVSLMYYDGATTAPKGTAENRGHSLGILTEEMYRISTSTETLELLEYLDKELNREDAQEYPVDEQELLRLRRMVFLMLKDVRQMQKIPMDEFVAYQELLVQADDIWHKAKEASDFPMFLPCLEKIFETQKRFAGYCAPDMLPYDYWLNEYEPGISMEVCDKFFDALRARLVPLIHEIGSAQQVDDHFLWGDFPEPVQEQLSVYLMDLMKLDREHCGLSTTEHPFTTSLGSHLDEQLRPITNGIILPSPCTVWSTKADMLCMIRVLPGIWHLRSWTAAFPWGSMRARAVSMKTSSEEAVLSLPCSFPNSGSCSRNPWKG